MNDLSRMGTTVILGAALLVGLAGLAFGQPAAPPAEQPAAPAAATPPAPTAPTARAVCEHLAQMVAADMGPGDPSFDQQMIAECETELAVEAELRGAENWNGIASCVLQATTEAEIDVCDQTWPLPGSAEPAPTYDPALLAAATQERAVCDHIIQMAVTEAGAAAMLTPEDLGQMSDECTGTLVTEERPLRSPEAYAQFLACLGAAQSTAQLDTCQ